MAKEEALAFLRSCWSSVFGQSDLKDSTHRDPESVSKRRAKGRAKGPSPWTTVTTAYTYVGAAMELLGHILMIVGICWASWKFSTSHDKIVDPFKRCRYYATLSLLPVVLYTTGKHWSQGTHFPLTASRSFQVLVRDWWTVECPEELKGIDLLQWLGNGIFFCYIGSWNFLLLFQRRGDPEVFDFAARLLVPLLIFSCCLRPQMLLALPPPSRPLAEGAMQGSQMSAWSGEGGPSESARSHSISLLPDLPSSCDSSEVMHGPSHSAEAAHSKNFQVKVAHQGTSHERQKESRGSQASHASGFLAWKEPSDPGPPSAVHHDSSGNRRRVRFQEPIATVAQYLYEMTQPNVSEGEEAHQSSQPQPLHADAAVLKTTVNCTSELTQMYTRRTGSKRARKNQENHTHPSSSTHHNSSGHGGDEGFKNPIATVAQYLYQMTRPHEPQPMPQETQPDQSQPPPLQTTVNCSQELTDMYTRHGSHRSKKSRKHSERTARSSSHGSLENILKSQKEHSDARKVAFEKERWAHEFEKRVLERAYFLYINGVSEDEMYNYFEALRIEFGQRPY